MNRKFLGILIILLFSGLSVYGQVEVDGKEIGINVSLEGGNFSKAVNILLLMTILSLVPSFIMMM